MTFSLFLLKWLLYKNEHKSANNWPFIKNVKVRMFLYWKDTETSEIRKARSNDVKHVAPGGAILYDKVQIAYEFLSQKI